MSTIASAPPVNQPLGWEDCKAMEIKSHHINYLCSQMHIDVVLCIDHFTDFSTPGQKVAWSAPDEGIVRDLHKGLFTLSSVIKGYYKDKLHEPSTTVRFLLYATFAELRLWAGEVEILGREGYRAELVFFTGVNANDAPIDIWANEAFNPLCQTSMTMRVRERWATDTLIDTRIWNKGFFPSGSQQRLPNGDWPPRTYSQFGRFVVCLLVDPAYYNNATKPVHPPVKVMSQFTNTNAFQTSLRYIFDVPQTLVDVVHKNIKAMALGQRKKLLSADGLRVVAKPWFPGAGTLLSSGSTAKDNRKKVIVTLPIANGETDFQAVHWKNADQLRRFGLLHAGDGVCFFGPTQKSEAPDFWKPIYHVLQTANFDVIPLASTSLGATGVLMLQSRILLLTGGKLDTWEESDMSEFSKKHGGAIVRWRTYTPSATGSGYLPAKTVFQRRGAAQHPTSPWVLIIGFDAGLDIESILNFLFIFAQVDPDEIEFIYRGERNPGEGGVGGTFVKMGSLIAADTLCSLEMENANGILQISGNSGNRAGKCAFSVKRMAVDLKVDGAWIDLLADWKRANGETERVSEEREEEEFGDIEFEQAMKRSQKSDDNELEVGTPRTPRADGGAATNLENSPATARETQKDDSSKKEILEKERSCPTCTDVLLKQCLACVPTCEHGVCDRCSHQFWQCLNCKTENLEDTEITIDEQECESCSMKRLQCITTPRGTKRTVQQFFMSPSVLSVKTESKDSPQIPLPDNVADMPRFGTDGVEQQNLDERFDAIAEEEEALGAFEHSIDTKEEAVNASQQSIVSNDSYSVEVAGKSPRSSVKEQRGSPYAQSPGALSPRAAPPAGAAGKQEGALLLAVYEQKQKEKREAAKEKSHLPVAGCANKPDGHS
jgi:hypothetical protein